MKELLVNSPNYTNEIPRVEIGICRDKVYSFDTRRLLAHTLAKEQNPGVFIRYKKISGEHLQKRIDKIFSPRPWNGIVTAMRYGGKNSESQPYINPPLRPQLENSVGKGFKYFPNVRNGADTDPNGFPIVKKKAEKIYSFLQEKDKNGSETAKKILEETKNTLKSKGPEAARNYLIAQKEVQSLFEKNDQIQFSSTFDLKKPFDQGAP
ncbi:expressed protein [Dictyostelium purpureum]|uniref:Expressed protein n=1 Tax=Dictyostelium purpureum TaxID=5786 RepID=F0ZGR9_DICPU|nr:uncharacterized protein DICPUDRAFT_91748 [Dictyostelium purpureum]EGC36873.1 expressed protein [Dictyostelium purpureum]|eukprot:XP_003286595.1 expressed protein [Dictyostelium purpureum]